MRPKINEGQKSALCYHDISALIAMHASMSQSGVRSSGDFEPGGFTLGFAVQLVTISNDSTKP